MIKAEQETVLLIRTIDEMDAHIEKPEFGKPCNGCGYCCKEKACKLSIEYLKSDKAPCVALEFEGGRYFCGLVRNPVKHLAPHLPDVDPGIDAITEIKNGISVSFAAMLGLGAGCDSD